MMNKKSTFLVLGFLLAIVIFQFGSLNAAPEATFCAERTTDLDPDTEGVQAAWCQNVPESQVDKSFRYSPTSCESTSYCKTGTCVDSSNGLCEQSSSTRCDSSLGGSWYDDDAENLPQCQTGCCLIGDQAAFVTQTRCQKLSSEYVLEINFRADITSETSCIASATPKAKGACVYETESGRTCDFTTKQECNNFKTNNPEAQFREGLLCSNPDLGADCGMTTQTTCLEGKDEVYFIDSCGNPANVYDSSKVEDTTYWSFVPGIGGVSISQGDGAGNIGSVENGNCDYYLGSTCKAYDRSLDSNSPDYGDYICRDLGCEWEGQTYSHGETWCAEGANPGISGDEASSVTKMGNNPGDRDVRLVCYNGEVTEEPCADFRQEVCVQTEVGAGSNTFTNAVCRANRWRDCYSQDSQRACENTDLRDCQWIYGEHSISILKGENGEELVWNQNEDKLVPKETYLEDNRGIDATEDSFLVEAIPGGASCIPKYSPGFDFWNENTEAADICDMGSVTCIVQYEQGIGDAIVDAVGGKGNWHVVQYRNGLFGKWWDFTIRKNAIKICLDDKGNVINNWATEVQNMCSMLGDCGVSVNYIDATGYYDSYKEGSQDDLFTIEGNLG